MNSKDLRELAPLFSHFDAYRQVLHAAEERSINCDCVEVADTTTRLRRYQLAGRCADAEKPADSCQTVVHLGIRAHLATIAMPVDHMGDDELDRAVDVLHGLVLRAPQVTRQQFVDQLRTALHADRAVAAEAAAPAPGGDRAQG